HSAFNQLLGADVHGTVDTEALEKAFKLLVKRHGLLRSIFKDTINGPQQTIQNDPALEFSVVDAEAWTTEQLNESLSTEADKPFNLEEGPLIRARFYKKSKADDVSTLVFITHHIVSDFWTTMLLSREFSTLYQAFAKKTEPKLPRLTESYRNHVARQQVLVNSEQGEKQWQYWRNELAGDLPALDLPTDYPRSDSKSFAGETYRFRLSPENTARLRKLAKNNNTTLSTVMMGALKLFLYRYSGQKDLIVGTPTWGRNNPGTEWVVGDFANPVAIRTRIRPENTFTKHLSSVKETLLGAMANDQLPFPVIVERINPKRDSSRTPIFQVMYVWYQNSDSLTLDGDTSENDAYFSILDDSGSRGSAYDMLMAVVDEGDTLNCIWTYATDLFTETTVSAMAVHYQHLLMDIVNTPTKTMDQFEMSAAQPDIAQTDTDNESQSAVESADPLLQLDTVDSVASLLSERVTLTPNKVALQYAQTSLTYQEIDDNSNAIAQSLVDHGVGQGSVVGLFVSDPIAYLQTYIGLMKISAVACSVPPHWPVNAMADRLSFFTGLVVTDKVVTDQALSVDETLAINVIAYDGLIKNDGLQFIASVSPWDTAYIDPISYEKVNVHHGALIARINELCSVWSLSAESTVAITLTPATPYYIETLFAALICGATINLGYQEDVDHSTHSISDSNIDLWITDSRKLTQRIDANIPLDCQRVVLLGEPLILGESPSQEQGDRLGILERKEMPERIEMRVNPLAGLMAFQRYSADKPTEVCETFVQDCLWIGNDHGLPNPNGVEGYCFSQNSSTGHTQNAAPAANGAGFERINTFEQGFRDNDGLLHFKSTGVLRTRKGNECVSLSLMSDTVKRFDSVHDALLLNREDTSSRNNIVAYVVSKDSWDVVGLEQQFKENFPSSWCPDSWVHISRIPKDSFGDVDYESLFKLPVLIEDKKDALQKRIAQNVDEQSFALSWDRQYPEKELLHVSQFKKAWRFNIHTSNTGGSNAQSTDVQSDNATSINSEGGNLEKGDVNTSNVSKLAITPPLSLLDGGSLSYPESEPASLADVLVRAARDFPENGIRFLTGIDDGNFIRYPELLSQAKAFATYLKAASLVPGDKVIFQLVDNEAFIIAFWACAVGGFVPVPLALCGDYDVTNADANKLINAWRLLGNPTLLCSKEVEESLSQLPETADFDDVEKLAFQALTFCPEKFCSEQFCSEQVTSQDDLIEPVDPDALSLLLLTSGSTGVPKAVKHSHKTLMSRSKATADFNALSGNDVTLNWMPLDHVGGLIMFHLRDVFIGANQIHAITQPVIEKPTLWLDWIEKYKVTFSWAPNFAYGLVNEAVSSLATPHWDLSSVRLLLNGGEAVVARTARRFLQLLKPCQLSDEVMLPAWGMSETGSGVLFNQDFRLSNTDDSDAFVCVGSPTPGTSICIVDEDDRILPEGSIGRLKVKGPSVTLGYYNNDAVNDEVFDEQGWFDTGDL
ncbi:MAG: AMP-binding protein, partial [Pseudomonadales bacterium]|nr:AMP-binding protein [Pseudomonadales bacterium]